MQRLHVVNNCYDLALANRREPGGNRDPGIPLAVALILKRKPRGRERDRTDSAVFFTVWRHNQVATVSAV